MYTKPIEMVGNMLGYPSYVLQAGTFLAGPSFLFTCPFCKQCIFVGVCIMKMSFQKGPNLGTNQKSCTHQLCSHSRWTWDVHLRLKNSSKRRKQTSKQLCDTGLIYLESAPGKFKPFRSTAPSRHAKTYTSLKHKQTVEA